MKRLIFISAVLAILSSCATVNLETMNIVDARIEISHHVSNEMADTLVPGKSYDLSIIVTDAKANEHVIKYDHPEIEITYPNESFKEGWFGSVRTTQNTLRLVNSGVYSVNVSFLTNPHPGISRDFPIDFTAISEINFNGADGSNGLDGSNGMNNFGSSQYSLDGGDGADGAKGADGWYAGDPEFIIFNYNFDLDTINKESYFVLIELQSKTAMILPKAPLTINANGGKGGDGGNGGDAGTGGEYKDPTSLDVIAEGNDGEPGSGGSGGNGGNGGNIRVYHADKELLSYLSYSTLGGKGGSAGEPGKPANFGISQNGPFVNDGNDGTRGSVNLLFLSTDEMQEKLSSLDLPELDYNKIIW